MPVIDLVRRLDTLIADAADTAARLGEVLEAEREALRTRDREALERLAPTKQELARQLEAAGAAQLQVVQALGLGGAESGLAERLQAAGLVRTAAAWQDLAARLARCRDLNRANGQAINHSRRTTERLIDFLHGRDANQRLYGPRGQDRASASLGYLAKA